MKRKISFCKNTLMSVINEMTSVPWLFVEHPEKDFTRKSKIGFRNAVLFLLSSGAKSLQNELLDFFSPDADVPSSSAFVQCREKIIPEAFSFLLDEFTSRCCQVNTYRNYRLLAADGSDIQIPTNPDDSDSFFTGPNCTKDYSLMHLNALYDINSHVYMDAICEGRQISNEQTATARMIDRSAIKENVIITADRGYESYNLLAHVQNRKWKFLFRIKNGTGGIVSGLELPSSREFDVSFNISLMHSDTKKARELRKDRNRFKKLKDYHAFDLPLDCMHEGIQTYDLSFRIVRFVLSDNTVETVITNLDPEEFPADEIRKLYGMRWGIETSFRKLKYSIGMLSFHSRKTKSVIQEILAALIMYNFAEMTVSCTETKENCSRKHVYQTNFSAAVNICRQLFRDRMEPEHAESLILRFIQPVRPGRKFQRNATHRKAVNFYYRIS